MNKACICGNRVYEQGLCISCYIQQLISDKSYFNKKERLLLYLKYNLLLSNEEIAKELAISKDRVKILIGRVHRKIKEYRNDNR